MDELDAAQAVEELYRDSALKRIEAGRYTGVSAELCVLCGVDIPLARRLALPGVQTCVDCQELKERRAKLLG